MVGVDARTAAGDMSSLTINALGPIDIHGSQEPELLVHGGSDTLIWSAGQGGTTFE
jgi:hypothetical protein